MKILYAGNMANVGYMITRQLRQDGLDVNLLMEKNPPFTSDPLQFDPKLNESYPNWILFFDKKKSSWKTDIIKIMRNKKYNLIHAHVELPIFSYLSRRMFIAQVLGSDLRELAFTNSVKGILLRRALRKAKVVFFYEPLDPSLLSKLNIKTGIHLPVMWDTSFFRPLKINKAKNSGKFVIFHPANLDWRLKGNDILLKGYSKFLQNHQNSQLILINRGEDAKKTYDLVNKLSINEKVKFIEGPLNASELLQYYNLSDIVADQFVLDGVGGIGAEAFSCEKPLLTFCTESTYGDLYAEPPPAVNANTPDEIANKLELLSDTNFRKTIGKKGREWVTKYHSSEMLSKRIHTVYEMVLAGKKIDEIRANI